MNFPVKSIFSKYVPGFTNTVSPSQAKSMADCIVENWIGTFKIVGFPIRVTSDKVMSEYISLP